MPEFWGRVQPILCARAPPRSGHAKRRAQAQRPGGPCLPDAAGRIAVGLGLPVIGVAVLAAVAAGLSWVGGPALGPAVLPATAGLAAAAEAVVAAPPGLAVAPAPDCARGALPAAGVAACGSPRKVTGIRNGHHS